MSERRYPWIETTNQKWKYWFEAYLGMFGFFAFAFALVFAIAGLVWKYLLFVSGGLILLYILGGLVEMYIFYYTIKCPRCGHNPTRRKDGGWASPRYLEGKFRKMTNCPQCGAPA